eukprot:GHVT01030767.1.p1 GENE.GHVT01030767.1~~GHVT01030767.1.p1  ORF type:complete len:759 (-),score=151.53 GHVT01030767.1:1712-3988(-)
MADVVVLMVAEKPSIADTIATFLSNKEYNKRKGISPVTSVWEFNGTFQGRRAFFKVTSTAGHIFSVDFPPKYNNWDKIEPLDLFDAPVEKKESSARQRMPAHLAKEAKGCSHLVLWLDCDREGENICFEVIDICKPMLTQQAGHDNIWRAHFSALAKPDIIKALNSLGRPDKNQADSVDARQELDLKVGCAWTRFQTRYFQGKYGDLDSSLVSYGPCQTPTLQFCVGRWDAIQTFQPENFYKLDVKISAGESFLWLEWQRGQVFDHVVACTFKQIVSGSGPDACVSDVSEKMESLVRPQALNTVAMLKLASQKLSMGPQQAMHTAERLYLSGFITYPRTETSQYPASFDLKATVNAQRPHPIWGSEATKLLQAGLNTPRAGTDVGDHPPITPVRAASEGQLGGPDEWRLYELVTRNFLASVSPDCKFLKRKVVLQIGGELFSVTGRKLIDPGFTAVLRQGEMQDVSVPDFNVGQRVPIQEVKISSGMTSPPSCLSESELLGLMDAQGIGTDASMATHINNICERNFVTLVANRRLEPTKLGISLVHGYMHIDSELVMPSVRATIEGLCAVVAKGQANVKDVVKHSLDMFKLKFAFFLKHIERMDALFEATFTALSQTGSPISRCGKCNRYLNLIAKRPMRLHCRACNETYALPSNGAIKLYKELKCPLDNFELILFTQKGGKTFPLCPLCYNEPPFESSTKKMSCVDCAHPTCKHSIQSLGICKCPQDNCDGTMYLDVVSAVRNGRAKWNKEEWNGKK